MQSGHRYSQNFFWGGRASSRYISGFISTLPNMCDLRVHLLGHYALNNFFIWYKISSLKLAVTV